MTIHLDFAPAKNCKHPELTYGELCVKCGECGRFEYGGDRNPVKSEILLVSQYNPGIPPIWELPQREAIYFQGKWWPRNKTFKEADTIEKAMPECWHKRELDYVRWWILGKLLSNVSTNYVSGGR